MTDILLDQQGGNWVVVNAAAFKVAGSDISLDSPGRRGNSGGQYRRALVHDENDGLTINFNNDYPGGVTIAEARVILKINKGPKLPRQGRTGELYLMETDAELQNQVFGTSTSLWVCVNVGGREGGDATWQEIPLGQKKTGEV